MVIDPFSPKIYSYCLLICFVLYPENLAWQSWGWGPQNDRQIEVRLPLHFLQLRSCQGCQLSEELSESFFPLLAFGRGCGSCRGFLHLLWGLLLYQSVTEMQVHLPEAQSGPTIPKCQSVEQRKVYWEPTKEMGSTCFKNPRLPKSSRQCPFLGMVREGCGELLQTSWFQSLCSSVRSWSGKHVPINLYQISIFLHLIRKNKFPRLNQTLRDPSPAERRQSSVCGSLRDGSPEILSSCHPWSSQASRSQLALRFLRLPWQRYPRPHRLHLLPLSHGDGGKQERVIASSRPEPGLTEDTALSPGLWAHRLAQGWRAGGRRPGSTSYLILCPRTTFPLAVGCIAH